MFLSVSLVLHRCIKIDIMILHFVTEEKRCIDSLFEGGYFAAIRELPE